MPDIATLGTLTATIANGQTTSDAIDCSSGRTLVGLYLPGALTGTTFAFTACATSGGTYVPVYDVEGGSAYSVTVGTSRYVPVDPTVFAGARFLKLVSASEGGVRSISCAVRVV
jgi:hypothetical protein